MSALPQKLWFGRKLSFSKKPFSPRKNPKMDEHEQHGPTQAVHVDEEVQQHLEDPHTMGDEELEEYLQTLQEEAALRSEQAVRSSSHGTSAPETAGGVRARAERARPARA